MIPFDEALAALKNCDCPEDKKKVNMKNIQLPSGKYLLIDVPKDAQKFDIDNGQLYFKAEVWSLAAIGHLRKLPFGDWKIKGMAEILGFNQLNDIVDKIFVGDDEDHDWLYKNYDDGNFNIMYPQQSLFSLIASQSMKPETTLILKREDE